MHFMSATLLSSSSQGQRQQPAHIYLVLLINTMPEYLYAFIKTVGRERLAIMIIYQPAQCAIMTPQSSHLYLHLSVVGRERLVSIEPKLWVLSHTATSYCDLVVLTHSCLYLHFSSQNRRMNTTYTSRTRSSCP